MPFSCNLNFSVFFKLKNHEENHVPEGRILMNDENEKALSR